MITGGIGYLSGGILPQDLPLSVQAFDLAIELIDGRRQSAEHNIQGLDLAGRTAALESSFRRPGAQNGPREAFVNHTGPKDRASSARVSQ
jgi:hypothetical protein